MLIPKTINKNGIIHLTTYLVLLILLFFDKYITIINFGIVYTDIDQIIMWNGAIDYARGIFREPFFYGQSYNYMIESFLSVPLILTGIPVYKALPIITNTLTIFPFIFLSVCFLKKRKYFWSLLSLSFPILLPLEYNLITSISRGFVQAHLFVPFLFIPFLNPENKKNITLFYIVSALSFIVNQSSIIIIIPIFTLLLTYHYKNNFFYKRSIIALPILLTDFVAKYHYTIHPEKVTHTITGVRIDIPTLIKCLTRIDHFENLFPIFSNLGVVYIIIFISLAIYTKKQSLKREFYFTISVLITLFITFSIPKVQSLYENGGIFFSISRLYLFLPLTLITTLFLIFKNLKIKIWLTTTLIVLSIISFTIKNYNIDSKVETIVQNTSFPVVKNQNLIEDINNLNAIIKNNNINLVIHPKCSIWHYHFLSYAYKPLLGDKVQNVNLVTLTKDRRTWIYKDSSVSKNILLMGFNTNSVKLDQFDYEKIGSDKLLIKNNNYDNKSLLKHLNTDL